MTDACVHARHTGAACRRDAIVPARAACAAGRGERSSPRGPATARSPKRRASPPSTTRSSRRGSTRRDRQLATRLSAGAAPKRASRSTAVALWWRDPARSGQPRARRTARAARARPRSTRPSAWTRREPKRAEAWFYLAGSYAPLVQWRALRGERLAAARDGNRIRAALERALALDPHAARRVLRHRPLPLLRRRRAGRRARSCACCCCCRAAIASKGCARCCRRASRACCCAARPTSRLHWLYLWYEHAAATRARAAAGPRRALSVEPGLPAAHRRNPARLPARSPRQRRRVADAARARRARRVEASRAIAETRARIGLARSSSSSSQPQRGDRSCSKPRVAAAVRRAVLRRTRSRSCYSAPRTTGSADRDLANAAYTAAIARRRATIRSRSAIARAIAARRTRERRDRAMMRALSRRAIEIFDKTAAFVLDITIFSTIIYIWYEGGQLRPSLVRLRRSNSTSPFAPSRTQGRRRRCHSDERRRRVSVPGGSHRSKSERSRSQTHMKGGIKDNGEESQGREEEGRQEAVS